MAACRKGGVLMKGDAKIMNALFAVFCSIFYGQFIELISLKAPGNYCASIWTNQFLILLLEKPKPDIFMVSGFFGTCRNLYLWI